MWYNVYVLRFLIWRYRFRGRVWRHVRSLLSCNRLNIALIAVVANVFDYKVRKTYLRDDRSFASLSTRKVTSPIPSRQTISDVTFLGWREATTGNTSVLAGYLRIELDWDRLWIIVQSLGAVYRWFAQNVTVAMLVDQKKLYCFINQHGRLAT